MMLLLDPELSSLKVGMARANGMFLAISGCCRSEIQTLGGGWTCTECATTYERNLRVNSTKMELNPKSASFLSPTFPLGSALANIPRLERWIECWTGLNVTVTKDS